MPGDLTPIQYSIVTSDRSVMPRPPTGRPFAGRVCLYRLGFVAMEVPGLPDDLIVGGVHIRQSHGPEYTQGTAIIQRPGLRVRYEKHMEGGNVVVGSHLLLTIGELYTIVPADVHLDRAMAQWHDRVLASLAAVAIVLDERIAHTPVLEDVLIDQGQDRHAIVDRAVNLREYSPANKVGSEETEVLSLLSRPSLSDPGPASAAARWYLRGAQAGPTADGAVFMFIALEALVAPRPGKNKKSFEVKAVKAGIEKAGGDASSIRPSVGHLAGLRADLVHHGKEQPPLLYEGFYALEWIVRLLLRDQWKIDHAKAWPLAVQETKGVGLKRTIAEVARRLPKRTVWRGRRELDSP